MGSQVLDVKIVNCGGLRDLMSEMESSFLVSALGLFRNHQALGKGYPRANVNLVRAYKAEHFYRAAFGEFDVLHVIGHANGDQLDVGVAKRRVEASRLDLEARRSPSDSSREAGSGRFLDDCKHKCATAALTAEVCLTFRSVGRPTTDQ